MKRFKKEEIREIINKYLNANSTVKIALEYNTQAPTIRSILLRNNIKLRTISEAMINIHYNTIEEKDEHHRLLKSIKNHFYSFMWKSSVAVRDNFTCQMCGIVNNFNTKHTEMHIDHIKPFSKIFKDNNIKSLEQALNCKEFWDIDNGRCLCAVEKLLLILKELKKIYNQYIKKKEGISPSMFFSSVLQVSF